MSVIAPVPYFPHLNVNQRWSSFAKVPRTEQYRDFEVDHPRYVVFPKVGMVTHGVSMFAGSLLQVRRRATLMEYDLIDAHHVYPDGLAATMLGAFLKKPVVVSARGSDINVFPEFRSIRPLIKRVLTRADAVVAVSQALKDAMMSLGCPGNKITVIRNGIDAAKFRPQSRLTARQKLKLPVNRPILLSVGRLTENKGFHVLLDAVSKFRMKCPNVLLVLVGEGSYRSHLELQVQRLRLGQNVRFAGTYPHDDLAEWYSAANLFCLASANEGCPNVVIEALACGCPVVATAAGGTREIVTSPAFGLTVERTPEAFESAFEEALRRPWDQSTIAAHGRSYSWNEAAASLFKVYSEVLTRS